MQAFNVFLTSTMHVAFAHVFRPTRYADGDDASAAMRAKAGTSIDEYFSLIEEKLADSRPYVHGDLYTVSDPYLLVFSRWLDRSNLGQHRSLKSTVSDFWELDAKAHDALEAARLLPHGPAQSKAIKEPVNFAWLRIRNDQNGTSFGSRHNCPEDQCSAAANLVLIDSGQ